MNCMSKFFASIAFLFVVTTSHANQLALDLMPDKAKPLAEVAVKAMSQMHGIQLDYSPESLKSIDKAVLDLRKNGVSMQTVNKTLIVLGCYVGEVMVRNLGYKWDNPDSKEIALGFDVTGIRGENNGFSNPIGKVFKLMQNGEEDSVDSFYAAFSKDLSLYYKKQ